MKKKIIEGASPGALLARLALIAAWLTLPLLLARLLCRALPLIGILVLRTLSKRLFRRRASGTFGTARLAHRRALECAGMLADKGLILGRPTQERPPFWRSLRDLFTAPLSHSGVVSRRMVAALLGERWEPPAPLLRLPRFNHLLAVSPTGGGKGVSLVIPTLLTWEEGSVVVLDPKGENYALTSQVRRNMGQTVYRIDPFSVCGPGGCRFNPLDTIDESPCALNDCLALAEALVVRGTHEPDPHWNDSAVTCIQAFTYYVVCFGKPKERNLLTVRELITDADAFVGALIDMRRSDVAGGALRRLGGQMAQWQDKELSSILSATNRHLAFLDGPLVSDNLSTSDFDPADLVRQRMSVYMVLPVGQLQALARLSRLWLSSFVRRLAQGRLQEDNLCIFMLDEVGALGPMPVLKEVLTVLRGYGIRLYFFLQALGQLHSLFPDNKGFATAQACIDTQVYFSIRDRETAEEISAYIGDYTAHSLSEGTSRSITEPTLLATMFGAKGASQQITRGTNTTHTEVSRRLIQAAEASNSIRELLSS